MKTKNLKIISMLACVTVVGSSCFAQFNGSEPPAKSAKVVRRLVIRSADPLLIARLLSGNQNYFGSPEPTQSSYTFAGFGGGMMGGFGGASGQGGFGNSMGGNSGSRGM